MSARRSFIKNSLMALAVAFLPKILQPSVPEIEEEDDRLNRCNIWASDNTEDRIIEAGVVWNVYHFENGQLFKSDAVFYRDGDTIKMKVSEYEAIKNKVL